jgi:hypothetical protein
MAAKDESKTSTKKNAGSKHESKKQRQARLLKRSDRTA